MGKFQILKFLYNIKVWWIALMSKSDIQISSEKANFGDSKNCLWEGAGIPQNLILKSHTYFINLYSSTKGVKRII